MVTVDRRDSEVLGSGSVVPADGSSDVFGSWRADVAVGRETKVGSDD